MLGFARTVLWSLSKCCFFIPGMVEMIPNAETLRKIQVEHGVTGSFKDRPLADWLQKHNPTEDEYEKVSLSFHTCSNLHLQHLAVAHTWNDLQKCFVVCIKPSLWWYKNHSRSKDTVKKYLSERSYYSSKNTMFLSFWVFLMSLVICSLMNPEAFQG